MKNEKTKYKIINSDKTYIAYFNRQNKKFKKEKKIIKIIKI